MNAFWTPITDQTSWWSKYDGPSVSCDNTTFQGKLDNARALDNVKCTFHSGMTPKQLQTAYNSFHTETLPPNWSAKEIQAGVLGLNWPSEKLGKTVYYNDVTGETSYTKPKMMTVAQAQKVWNIFLEYRYNNLCPICKFNSTTQESTGRRLLLATDA